MKKTIIATLLATVLAACGGEQKAEAPAQNTPAAKKPSQLEELQAKEAAERAAKETAQKELEKTTLSNAAGLQKAQDELQALPQFAGKELNVFQDVNFYNTHIAINVQDPNKPENIDNYEYNFADGKWSEPSPVQLSGGGDMKPNLTPLKDIRFADVADKFIPLYKQTAEKEKITPVEPIPTAVSFVLFVPNQDRFWQASMNTERAQMTLRMKTDGTFKEIVK